LKRTNHQPQTAIPTQPFSTSAKGKPPYQPEKNLTYTLTLSPNPNIKNGGMAELVK
jgi:hypothetical protein